MVLFIGCQKSSQEVHQDKLADNTDNYVKSSTTYKGQEQLKLENNSVNTDLRTFFLSYDTAILKSLLITPIDDTIYYENLNPSGEQYMINKNVELISILQEINPISYAECTPNDPYVIATGMIELYYQLTENGTPEFNKYISNKNITWSCILEAAFSAAGIQQIITGNYKKLTTIGDAWTALKSFIGTLLKRLFWWAAAAKATYDIVTKCF